jgi:predicted MPP superfamily phosphohydrolase
MAGFIVFIGTVLAALLGVHYLLYATIVRFFSVTGAGARTALFTVLLVLSVSFLVTAALVRLHAGSLTEGLHLGAAFWLGLVLHLIPALALVWLVHLLARAGGHSLDMRAVCVFFFCLAAAASIYGAWKASHPRLTTVEVHMRGLPDEWRGETVVHLSDAHLGAVHGAGFMRRVVERVNALGPALVLITGDLFDGMGGDFASLAAPLDGLETSKGVFFVTGNHEGYLGLTKPLAALDGTQIRVLDDEVVEVDGLQIVGIGFPEHDRPEDARRIARLGEDIDPEKPSILMYHTPTDVAGPAENRGTQQTRTYWSPETRFSFAREHGIDLQLSGHTHAGQIFPFTLLARWIYDGYDYGLHELDGFTLYTTSGVGTWGPPLRTGSSSEIVAIRLRGD